jgi:hypothetical protein
MNVTTAKLSVDKLAHRRRASARLAWGLGRLVLLIYIGGLFIRR